MIVNFKDPGIDSGTEWLPQTLPPETPLFWAIIIERREPDTFFASPARPESPRSLMRTGEHRCESLAGATHIGFSARGLREQSGMETLPEALARRAVGRRSAHAAPGSRHIARESAAVHPGRRAWVVVQRRSQDLSAPHVPIVAGVYEVLMPDLIDDLARRHWRRRYGGEKTKAPVAVNRSPRFRECPPSIPRQPGRESQRLIGFEIVLLDAGPQLFPGRAPDVALYGMGGLP